MATFQILQTWIGHNTTCYHNVNVNLILARGNALQMAPNHGKLRENVWKRVK